MPTVIQIQPDGKTEFVFMLLHTEFRTHCIFDITITLQHKHFENV